MRRFFKEIGEYLKELFRWIINYIFLIWAHFPILALTSDKKFPNLQLPLKDTQDIRLSLLTFYFGEYIFHLLSFNFSNKQFSFIKKLSLSEHPNFNDAFQKEEIEKKVEKYEKELFGLDDKDLEIEKECLLKKLDDNNSRIDKTDSKINFFLAIILAIITLISFKSIKELDFSASVGNILKAFLLYFSINLCALLIQSMKVRSYYKLSLKDLRDSDDKNVNYLGQLYEDLLYTDIKADFFVSFVHRIFDYMKVIIIIGISIFIFSLKITKFEKTVLQDNKLVILNSENCFDNYSEDNIKLYEVLLALKNQNFSRVIIMTKVDPKKELVDTFLFYDRQKISYIIDESLLESDIKIILEN